jgi:hypothetical protein
MFRFLRNRPPMRSPGPIGLQRDQDFAPREPSLLGRLFGRASDGKIYWLDAWDAQRIKPIITRDPRALANEKAKAGRLERLRRAGAPFVLDPETGEYELAPPAAQILPAAPRTTPADQGVDGDWIVMPPGGDDGHHSGR